MVLSSQAGDVIADLLEPLVSVSLPSQEDLSTEEVLSQLEEAEKLIKEQGHTNVTAGSLDVKALYPSLDQTGASEAVSKFVLESKVDLEGVNWREVQTNVASNMDEHELKRRKIVKLVPKRLWTRGFRPGKTTSELSTKLPEVSSTTSIPKVSKWAETDPDSDLSEEDKRLLFSLALGIAVRVVFRHHLYSFAGKSRRQSKGGPIGLRLTSLVARIVMDQWSNLFLTAVTDAGLRLYAVMKYVDDVNLVMSLLDLGTRWEEGVFISKEEWVQQDKASGRTREDVTIEAVRCAANNMIPYLQFTADIPERHGSLMVPVLDIQVWVQRQDPAEAESGLGDTLAWKFYEKETASRTVLRAGSAYSWRGKIVTLGQEVFR